MTMRRKREKNPEENRIQSLPTFPLDRHFANDLGGRRIGEERKMKKGS